MTTWTLRSKPANGGVVVIDSPCDVYRDGYTQALDLRIDVALESIVTRARLSDVVIEDHTAGAVPATIQYTVGEFVQRTTRDRVEAFLAYHRQFPN